MTVSAVDTSTTTTAVTSATETPDPIQVETSEEFTQFIELLTVQVENQDPLEPMDSTQFVEQLATFSALEQQVQTNDFLEAILQEIRDAS